jgi:hypothetical protein
MNTVSGWPHPAIGLTETQHHPGGTGIEEHEYIGERFVRDELLYQVVSLVRRLCDDSTRWRAELVSKLGGRYAPKDVELCRHELTDYLLASRTGGRVGKRVAKLYHGILCFGTIVATAMGDQFPHYVRYPILSIVSTPPRTQAHAPASPALTTACAACAASTYRRLPACTHRRLHRLHSPPPAPPALTAACVACSHRRLHRLCSPPPAPLATAALTAACAA